MTEPISPQPPPLPAQPVVLSYGLPDLQPERPLIPMFERIVYFPVAVLLPITCFAMSFSYYPAGPEWQSGRWHDDLGMIPRGSVGWPFYPLLLFSMYAAFRTLVSPRTAINLLHVRVGLFTGVLLAMQYSFIQTVCIIKQPLATGILLGIGVPLGVMAVLFFARWAADQLIWSRRWYRGRGKWFFWTGGAALILAAALVSQEPFAIIGAPIFVTLIAAPAMTLTSFAMLSLTAIRKGQSQEGRPVFMAWVGGWLAAFAMAWFKSYTAAMDAYLQLPTTRPGCYIATAAMHGHCRFVGRRVIDGIALSPQLAMLKAGELAIRARWPRVHRAMRTVYDVIGPQLASGIRNPVMADLVYVTLKPFEWATAACLVRLTAK